MENEHFIEEILNLKQNIPQSKPETLTDNQEILYLR